MAGKSEIMKQYMNLAKNITSFSNGQATLSEANNDDDTLDKVNITITPKDGYYRHSTLEFEIDMGDDYPQNPPRIHCLNNVYHPNIDTVDEYSEGDICLNLMDELWTPELTLEDYIQGLLFMLYEPNTEDPLNSAFCGDEDEERWSYNIRRSMRGKEVEGATYDIILPDGYESDDGETYDEEYDDYVKLKNGSGTASSDPISDGESDVSSLNSNVHQSDDLVALTTKSDDVITLPTINEATGQSEPVNVNIKPLTNLISIISRLIRFIRPPLQPSESSLTNTVIVRPAWRLLLVSSIAIVSFRIGFKLFLRTPLILR